MINKIVCYTAITGSYDTLKSVPKMKGIDFVCFTDNDRLISDYWKILPIPLDLCWLSDVKKQRILKICPHRYLKDYDISIWVDGNIQIISDLNEFIAEYDLEKSSFYTRVHPGRNCIYQEAKACINMNKDTIHNIEKQINRYRQEGYPKHIGMAETNIILRKHNNKDCILLDEAWATELLKESHRDLLSFNYICWKLHKLPSYLINLFEVNNNKYFRIYSHG